MARTLRLHVSGGFYHVTLRGNHRQPIFFEKSDRELLDSIVAEVAGTQNARIHAFCWMTNHLHAVIQVYDVPLGRIVLRIASRYARTVQSRLATTGHLFERRYHCVLVDAEEYLLTLIRYIHLNPVRAGLVRDPEQYSWSSHNHYLGREFRDWVTADYALRLFARERQLAMARYADFMGEPGCEKWGEAALALNAGNPQILGGDEFAARVQGISRTIIARRTLEELVAEGCRRFNLTTGLLISPSKSRGLAAARAWIAHEALAGRVATICAVARCLQRSESSIRELMARYPRADKSFQIRESATRHH